MIILGQNERVLYVSGPLRAVNGAYGPFTPHVMERNMLAAKRVAILGWRAGWAVICPHLNTQMMDGVDGLDSHGFISGDLTFLDRMIPGLDAVIFLKGWTASEGAQIEQERAARRGLATCYEENLGSDELILNYLKALYQGYASGRAFFEEHCGK